MKDKIRLGIIGCGGIARSRHITGMTMLKRAGLDNFDVTACCDISDEDVQAVAAHARQHQGANPQIYHDWEEMVCKAPIDAVDICLPHGLHHVVGISCLDAGLHVLMEKPYTVSMRTGRALAEAADRASKVLATAVPHRRMPGERAVHWALNEAKLIGDVRTFFQNYTQWRAPVAPTNLSPKMKWRYDRAMGGGAGVIDSGFHFLDSIRYFYGEPEQVYAEVRAYRDGQPTIARDGIADERENTVMALFTFKSGVVGTWCFSFAVAGTETRDCVISGSEGSIEDTNYSNRYVVFHQFMGGGELRRRDGLYLSMEELQSKHRQEIGPDRVQQLFPNGVTDHFAIEIWDFLDAIEKNRPPEVDGWGGLATLALVEAIYESSWSGRAIRIDDMLAGDAPTNWQREIDAHWDEHQPPRLIRE
ncbi:MAG: Gfo/Idh/MocA family oxidoreductase [Chloroflexi bacterium]|nr:Gfo/Idh/MocA family oxidoreductase [Chloroflexota bacterium]